jgi:opacity protein-like surface antigen
VKFSAEVPKMKVLASVATLAVLIGASLQASVADTPEASAEAAAQTWLGLVDAGDYAKSWDTSARYFRNSVPQSQWASQVSAVRGPLGAVKSRRVASAKFTRSLPGAPDGEYVVITFSTSFEHKAEAAETVTPVKDPDGQWRVSGYFVR